MREIQPDAFTVYTFDELSEDVQEKVIDDFARKLGGDWWDQSDIDDISDVIRYTLANEFGVPGHGDYGVGDFPGIPGVELGSWDLDRGDFLGLSGRLTRENAPRLPWVDDIESVTLIEGSYGTSVDVEFDIDSELTDDDAQLASDAMEDAVETAVHAAKKSGREEMEYRGSEEYARNHVENGDYEFRADGEVYYG